MSLIPIQAELTLISSLRGDLALADRELATWAQNVSARPIAIPVQFNLAQQFAIARTELQRQVDANPIVIPVVYRTTGDAAGGAGGGGGVDWGDGSGGAATASGGGGGMGGGASRWIARRAGLLLAYAAVREIGENVRQFEKFGEEETNFGDTPSERIAQARKTAKEAQETASGFSGFLRGADTGLGDRANYWADYLVPSRALYKNFYGNVADQAKGISDKSRAAETQEETTNQVTESEKRIKSEHLKVTRLTEGASAARLEELKNWSDDEEKFVHTLASRKGGAVEAARKQAQDDVYKATVAADVARTDNANTNQAQLAAYEYGLRGQSAELAGQGRKREAGYLSERTAARSKLHELTAARDAQPRGSKAWNDLDIKVQAAATLATKELGAIDADEARETADIQRSSQEGVASAQGAGAEADLRAQGKYREAAMHARNRAIDERVQSEQDQYDKIKNDPIKGPAAKDKLDADRDAGEKEKAANAAEERRRVADEINEYEARAGRDRLSIVKNDLTEELKIYDKETKEKLAKIEDAGERAAAATERAARRQAIQYQAEQRVGDMNRQARDIELRSRGLGGLADAKDIEDETKRNLHDAGSDPEARRAAVNLGIAKTDALIREQGRPQQFGSTMDFIRGLQGNLFNGGASGLREAMDFNKLLKGNAGGLSRGNKLPGEDDPFSGSAQAFDRSTKAFDDAVDRFNKTAVGGVVLLKMN